MRTIYKGCRGDDVKILQRALHLFVDGIFGALTEEAVKDFQKENGIVADGIVGQHTWSKLLGKDSYDNNQLEKSKRFINEIIVHCTATPEGKDFTVDDVTRWHIKRGFSTIGYHYLIYRDGSVHKGRDINVSGAHCTGHNRNSIGVCYVGGCAPNSTIPKDTRTDAQKTALVDLLRKLRVLYPQAKIHGHRDFANKACPSFDATKEYKNI